MNSYISYISSLKDAESRLKSVIEMLESGHECLDVARHLHALEDIIFHTKKMLVRERNKSTEMTLVEYRRK
ncbi:metal-sensing transcriptional repressor [Collimonas fungivorans]|uniref:metal-sensing transcriptional repressor n=1 Tax=Collimonas fungivorans TaxID=158899 RepID=UPI000B16B9EB